MGCTYVSSLTDITNIQTVKLRRVLHHIAHSKTFAWTFVRTFCIVLFFTYMYFYWTKNIHNWAT